MIVLGGHHLLWAALDRAWYAPVFLIAVVLVCWGYITYARRLEVLVHHRYFKLLLPGYARWRGVLKVLLLTVAMGGLFIALLQPQWGKKEIEVTQEGRDVLIALDVSRSMLAQDVKPSRLAFTKLKVRKLLQKLSFERVGLILFSGNAFVQCPLTADYKTFQLFLDHVTPESISSGTTAIGNAINRAVEVFDRSKGRKNKLLLMVTDGEDFASDITQVVARIKKDNVTVLAWGVGSEQGAPIPVFDAYGKQQGNQKDAEGKLAITKLNPALLKQISAELEGRYEPLTLDDGDIDRIVEYVQQFEREALADRKMNQYHDRYPLFLALSWASLILEWLL